jgi:hypothetical protein
LKLWVIMTLPMKSLCRWWNKKTHLKREFVLKKINYKWKTLLWLQNPRLNLKPMCTKIRVNTLTMRKRTKKYHLNLTHKTNTLELEEEKKWEKEELEKPTGEPWRMTSNKTLPKPRKKIKNYQSPKKSTIHSLSQNYWPKRTKENKNRTNRPIRIKLLISALSKRTNANL